MGKQMKYQAIYCQCCGVPVRESAYVNGVYMENVCLSGGCAEEEHDRPRPEFTNLDDAYLFYLGYPEDINDDDL